MASTIEVEPELASKIRGQARSRGVSVDAYLRELIEEKSARTATTDGETLQEKVRALRKWAASHRVDTPGLSDEAVSRESIYGERG